MGKVELYRQVFMSFKARCARGEQPPGSFMPYCREHGVDGKQMRKVLKDEFQNIKTLPGYRVISRICLDVYEDFKQKCAVGKQPGSFADYYREYGITRKQMHRCLKLNKLKVEGLPGYVMPKGGPRKRCQEIPFEDVIFEEAGFLPADSGNVITVKVDGNVAVSFPADTDVVVIAKFVKSMGKEAGHVGT